MVELDDQKPPIADGGRVDATPSRLCAEVVPVSIERSWNWRIAAIHVELHLRKTVGVLANVVANGNGLERPCANGTPVASTTPKSTAPEQKPTYIKPQPSGPNKIYTNPEQKFGDWRDDLVRDGYVIVKGAISREKAEEYGDRMLSYLENFAGGLGFSRHDPSTVLEKHLPVMNEKGMVLGYGIQHEQFFWDLRQEPGVIEPFQRLWDTPDVVTSFDSLNMQWPNRKDAQPNNPWPHQDQDPKTWGFRCMQGLLNIFPNGEDDGELIVCPGAHALTQEFHEEFKDEPKIWSWTNEWYGFTDKGMAWLEKKGLKWVKPCLEPGDLILWDSRTPHYNVPPKGKHPRFCCYVCMAPAADLTQEDLKTKKETFDNLKGTSHWPQGFQIIHPGVVPVKRDGEDDPHNKWAPTQRPQLSEVGLRLVGIPYIQQDS